MRVPVALQESIPIAIGALRANKARGALTTLGIIIGIVAVVLTMTAANGLQNKFRETFSSVGSDVIYVSRMPWVVMNDFFRYRNRPGIALREARALEDRFRGRAIVNPTVNGQRDVKYPRRDMEGVTIIGTTEKQSVISSALPQTRTLPASVRRRLQARRLRHRLRESRRACSAPPIPSTRR